MCATMIWRLQQLVIIPCLVARLELNAGHVVEGCQDRRGVVEDEVGLVAGSNRLRSVFEVVDGREKVAAHEGDVDLQAQGFDLIDDGERGVDGRLNWKQKQNILHFTFLIFTLNLDSFLEISFTYQNWTENQF